MKQNNTSFTTYVLWVIYICLLAVLLPHTAWAFNKFEPVGVDFMGLPTSKIVSWLAAITFEAAIATLTHKLSELINATPKSKKGWQRFLYQYGNGFFFMLMAATIISMLANFAHAVEYGASLAIFTKWGIPSEVYSVAFGGALPLISLGFANVLSNVTDSEDAPNPDLEEAKKTILNIRQQLRDTEARVKASEQSAKIAEQASESKIQAAEQRAVIAEERFGAMGDLVRHLFGEDKRQRILTARRQWAALPNSAIAVIAEASPAYVSEILSKVDA